MTLKPLAYVLILWLVLDYGCFALRFNLPYRWPLVCAVAVMGAACAMAVKKDR